MAERHSYPDGFSRRAFLAVGLLGASGVAGCSADTADTDTPDGETAAGGTASGDGTVPRFSSTDHCSSDGRFRCLGRPIEDFERATMDGWQVWGGDVRLTDRAAAVGSRSVEMRVSRTDARCGIVRRFDGGVDLSGYDLSLAVRLESPENGGIIVQIRAPDRDNLVQSTRYCWRGSWLRLDHGPTQVRGDPDLTDVRELRVGMYRGRGQSGHLYVDSIRAAERRDRGAVAFIFDDHHVSQYEKAFPLLREFGYPGAVGVIPWKTDENDHVGLDGLAEMHDAGWEMVCHPQRAGTPLPEMGTDALRESIVETKQWLRDHGFASGARVVVWPFGQYDGRALSIATEHHDLGFSTATSPVGRITDPLIVPRVNAGNPENARRMVDLAERFNQVCLLMYHRITEKQRAIHARETDLRAMLDYVRTADVDVVSVPDLRQEVGSRRGPSHSV